VPHLEVLSYIGVFAVIWLSVILLGILAVRLSRAAKMGWSDRFLGGLFGLLKGMVATVVLVAILTMFLPDKSQILKGSLLSPYIQRAGTYLVRLTPEDLRNRYLKRHDLLLRYLEQKQGPQEVKKPSL
jgi:uncharacterized membrane protein required for colicin V production